MTNSIYIATSEPYSGKSLVSLGIMEVLLRRTKRLGVFRPLIETRPAQESDKNIDLLLQHFNLKIDYEDTYAFTRRQAVDMIGHGHYDDMMDEIIQKYKALEERCDFILCIGSDFEGEGTVMEFDFNADVARNLSCPVLLVTGAQDQTEEEVLSTVTTSVDGFIDRGCQLLGVVVNRAYPGQVYDIKIALEKELGEQNIMLTVIPANDLLSSPTVQEVADHLDAEILYGETRTNKLAYRNLIIAMKISNYLPYLSENALLITPGDRVDVILSALQAHRSQNYPHIAGILLTGGLKPTPAVDQLLEGLSNLVPILSVRSDTYQTAQCVSHVRSYITPSSRQKIALSLDLFEEYVDIPELEERISRVPKRGLTPKMFLYSLIKKAKADKRHIVLPEGDDERILKAADELRKRDIVDLTLLGDPDRIKRLVQRSMLDVDLRHLRIIDPRLSPKFEEYGATLYELRKHKGITPEHAMDLIADVSYFGTMMVYKGDADGMVSGAAHTTLHTIRPALQFVKTKPGFSVVSSVFFMALEDKVLVYGDCAVNPNPTAEQLAEIAIVSAETAQTFGIEPKVAMLSYSSGESGQGADVEKVRKATQIAKERRPDLKLDGPIQYDAAVDMNVAAAKMPGSQVAGQATVFIFPDLNTGNNTYKAVQRETGAIAVGPVLQGLKKPVNDLSRGCTVEDIINTVAITAIQAQNS